jgi:Zn-finger nucleic acid-binding protein
VSLLECGKCGGAYIARPRLFEMIKTRDEATAQAFIEAYGHQTQPEVGLSAVVYRRCPTCAKMMTRTQFAKGAKVIVDVCACGAWFDSGELARVMAFVLDGGLVRSAARIASAEDRSRAALSPYAPHYSRRVSEYGKTTTGVTPVDTAAIWSVFETVLKAPPRR